MNYYDENSKCIRADCPKCGRSLEKSLEWIARHEKQKTWGCPHCKHRFKVYVQLPGAAPDKPPPSMAEALYKAQHDQRLGFYSKVAGVSHDNANGPRARKSSGVAGWASGSHLYSIRKTQSIRMRSWCCVRTASSSGT
jgi:hypothetical protein